MLYQCMNSEVKKLSFSFIPFFFPAEALCWFSPSQVTKIVDESVESSNHYHLHDHYNFKIIHQIWSSMIYSLDCLTIDKYISSMNVRESILGPCQWMTAISNPSDVQLLDLRDHLGSCSHSYVHHDFIFRPGAQHTKVNILRGSCLRYQGHPEPVWCYYRWINLWGFWLSFFWLSLKCETHLAITWLSGTSGMKYFQDVKNLR